MLVTFSHYSTAFETLPSMAEPLAKCAVKSEKARAVLRTSWWIRSLYRWLFLVTYRWLFIQNI